MLITEIPSPHPNVHMQKEVKSFFLHEESAEVCQLTTKLAEIEFNFLAL